MMKKLITLMIVSLLLSACSKDFLDLHSKDSLSENTLYKNYNDVQLAINGIYDVLQSSAMYGGANQGSPGSTRAGLCQYDGLSDNLWNRIRFEGPGFFVAGSILADDAFFSAFWASNYTGIARSNLAISNIKKMTDDRISDDQKNELLAQCYFLRALFYFNLAVYFEDVPLILAPQTIKDAFVSKNTQREVLDQVILDLTTAQQSLPWSQPSNLYGYATKGAALGLLARVYLFDKNWPEAANAAKSIIESKQYNLNTSYQTLFTYAGEKSQDVVFSVRFQEAGDFNTTEIFSATHISQPKIDFMPMANLVNDYYCTDGKPISTSPLFNSSNPKLNRDPRLLASVWFKGDVFITDLNAVFKNNETGYGLKKYIRSQTTPLGATTAQRGGQDFYVIRYADILLMRAEALIESENIGS